MLGVVDMSQLLLNLVIFITAVIYFRFLGKVYSVITYTNLILSKPKGFIGGNLKAALLPVPKLLPVFEFALPVDPEFLLQSLWQLPNLHS